MKTFENITELSISELLKIDGGYKVPSGSAFYDAVYAILCCRFCIRLFKTINVYFRVSLWQDLVVRKSFSKQKL